MKKFLRFIPICALIVSIVAVVLSVTTDGVVSGSTSVYAGSTCLFGKSLDVVIGSITVKGSALALVGWILGILSAVLIAGTTALDIVKGNEVGKLPGILHILSGILLLLAGIFTLCLIPSMGLNDLDFSLGAGWIVAGILYLVGAVACLCPTLLDMFNIVK